MSCSTSTTVLSSSSTSLPQHFHDLHRVLHVQVVQRLVQQHVLRVLRHDHRDKRPLPLTAAELVQKLVLQITEVHVLNGLVDVLCRSALVSRPWE